MIRLEFALFTLAILGAGSCNYRTVSTNFSPSMTDTIIDTTLNSKNVEGKLDVVYKEFYRDSSLLDDFMNRIYSYDEVITLKRQIGKEPRFLTTQYPTEEEPYYWIQVGYDNGTRLEIVHNYYAYPEDQSIKYLNTISNSLIDRP